MNTPWQQLLAVLDCYINGHSNVSAHISKDGVYKLLWSENMEKDTIKEQNLKQRLSKLEYAVTQEDATEPPFQNRYWDNHRDGIYVDIVSGEVLFSSLDKFDSGCGWPSFSKPVFPEQLSERKDCSHSMIRTEVRSTKANSHLGHVFTDGPAPLGLRYCINSAALRFIPKEEMEASGYGEFLQLFESENKNI